MSIVPVNVDFKFKLRRFEYQKHYEVRRRKFIIQLNRTGVKWLPVLLSYTVSNSLLIGSLINFVGSLPHTGLSF